MDVNGTCNELVTGCYWGLYTNKQKVWGPHIVRVSCLEWTDYIWFRLWPGRQTSWRAAESAWAPLEGPSCADASEIVLRNGVVLRRFERKVKTPKKQTTGVFIFWGILEQFISHAIGLAWCAIPGLENRQEVVNSSSYSIFSEDNIFSEDGEFTSDAIWSLWTVEHRKKNLVRKVLSWLVDGDS